MQGTRLDQIRFVKIRLDQIRFRSQVYKGNTRLDQIQDAKYMKIIPDVATPEECTQLCKVPDQIRVEQSRVEHIRLDQIRVEQSRVEQCRVDQSILDQIRVEQSRLEHIRLDQS